MEILLIARYWDHRYGIASLRPKKIAKYLVKKGHKVTVLVDKKTELNDNSDEFKIVKCFFESGIFKRFNSDKKDNKQESSTLRDKPIRKGFFWYRIKKMLKKVLWFFYKTTFFKAKAKNATKNAYNVIKKDKTNYDFIISSFGPIENHFLASKIKSKNKSFFWVADYRDPLANIGMTSKKIYNYLLKVQRIISNKADLVTIVSDTWRDNFRNSGVMNVETLRSGFDIDDFNKFQPNKTNDKLTFSYTGSIYKGLSDLSPFVQSINELIDEGMIDGDKILINYAGSNSDEFFNQFNSINEHIKLTDYGFVSREKSLQLLFDSDILLHSLFCYPGYNGIITGKLGEYWESHKPVICIVTGSEKPTEFISIFNDSKTGFILDTTSNRSINELKQYIFNQYNRKMNRKKMIYERNELFINNFSYDKIVERLLLMIKEKRDI